MMDQTVFIISSTVFPSSHHPKYFHLESIQYATKVLPTSDAKALQHSEKVARWGEPPPPDHAFEAEKCAESVNPKAYSRKQVHTYRLVSDYTKETINKNRRGR